MEPQCNTDQGAPNIHSEFVKEEFYKWFENRGLLSELRAYMRQLMVKALDESNTNSKSGIHKKAATSPKLQAINLLLVDYLFHEDYLYTVSVFASEAQILETLPQYSRYVSETVRQHHRDPSCLPRFSRQETEDILDTLRLPPSQCEMRQAVQLYLSGQESLLTCVTRTLASHHTISAISNTNMEWAETIHGTSGPQLWSKEMQNLLLMAGVKLQHIQRMQHKWECIIAEEKRKSREESERDHLVQWSEREERLREEVGKEMSEEHSRLEERDRELNELADQLSEVHQDISQRLTQLQEQSEDLQEREKGLQEREMHQQLERELLEQRLSNIEAREEHLKLTVSCLTKQTVDASAHNMETPIQLQKEVVVTSDASVQVCESAIPGAQVRPAPLPGPQIVCANTQTVNTVDHEQQTSSSLEIDPQLQLRLQTEREKINELQEENMDLRAYALQQRKRIDELTNRAATLSTQLEESQLALTLLSGRESVPPIPMPVAVPTLPTPQNIFVAPTFGLNTPQRQGAGEESLFTPRPQQALSRPDGRRRPSRFAFSNNPNPTSEESSPTDEVIQIARARIQQLEAEGVAVQRSYQAFQTRLLNSDSVMFPPLSERPRIGDPLMRVRRTDLMPFGQLSTNHPPFHTNNYRPQERRMRSPEEDDSSSDQSLFNGSGRFVNIVKSRRLFNERNIKHYERWKQLKKKSQRRNEFDRQSNTSSDDDDSFRRPRRRNEVNKAKTAKTRETFDINGQPDTINIMRNRIKFTENRDELPRKENQLEQQNLPVLTIKEEGSHAKEAMSLNDKSREDKLKLEMEQSMKLIESVKVLLEVQNLMNQSGTGTLSNESLNIESLSKDSDDNIPNKKSVTENTSVLTVKRVDPVIQKITEDKNNRKRSESLVMGNICQDQDDFSLSKTHQKDSEINEKRREFLVDDNICQDQNEFFVSKRQQKDSEIKLEKERKDSVEQGHESLDVPNLRLVSPGLNVVVEGTTAIDVAEQDSGDIGTTSVTSASDILRELNPSRDSSDVQVSIGNDSHSEDFWN